jgi:Na+-transporting NADH:ubiquinone oxidoreductase subunit NqrC
MKEIEEIDEKKARKLIAKLEDLMVSREEMHQMKENAIKFRKVKTQGKLYLQSEKIKNRIEDIKVPTLEALDDD